MSPGWPGAHAAQGSTPRGVRSGNRRFVARNPHGRGRGWRLWVGAWVGGCVWSWLGLLWWRGWRLWVGVWGELRP